jgi:hypothetical protein
MNPSDTPMPPDDADPRFLAMPDDGEPCNVEAQLIHVTVPGSAQDPRSDRSIPGVEIHHSPPLHPDDVVVLDGLRVTSASRTLIDCAEFMSAEELRATFARARALSLLDPAALRASRERVEWRPSLAMLDGVIAEFCE